MSEGRGLARASEWTHCVRATQADAYHLGQCLQPDSSHTTVRNICGVMKRRGAGVNGLERQR